MTRKSVLRVCCMMPLLFVNLGSMASETSNALSRLSQPGSYEAAEGELEKVGAVDSQAAALITARLPEEIQKVKSLPNLYAMAKLAGALRIASAVPALGKRLEEDNQVFMSTTFYQHAHLDNDPIARALVAIGDPSVDTLAGLLLAPTKRTRYRAATALVLINTPASLAKREDYLKAGKDDVVRGIFEGRG